MEKIIEKLENGESLTTADFVKLGYSFESFLRYSQASEGIRKEFHNSVKTSKYFLLNWKTQNA